jgi:hypothetical protein
MLNKYNNNNNNMIYVKKIIVHSRVHLDLGSVLSSQTRSFVQFRIVTIDQRSDDLD